MVMQPKMDIWVCRQCGHTLTAPSPGYWKPNPNHWCTLNGQLSILEKV